MSGPSTELERMEWVIDQIRAMSETSNVAPKEWGLALECVEREWRETIAKGS